MQKLASVLTEDQIVELARQTGFSKLQRATLTPMMFLKMVLFDHLLNDQPSLEQHSYNIFDEHGKKISKQGVDKRFNEKAVHFIKTLFENYLNKELAVKLIPSSLRDHFTAALVMDSTEFKLPATLAEVFPGFTGNGTDACAQIQFEFDILSGKIQELSVENGLVSDKTYADERIANIPAGALLLRDLGYYSVDMYKKIEDQQAWYVSRLKPQVSIYEKQGNGYKELSHGDIIKRLKQSGLPYLDIDVFIGKEVKHPVRLIANLLDEQAVARRVKRKKHRKARLNKKDRQQCQLNLFVTNLSAETASADEVYRLYKIRWQVELIFKTWKSILKIDKIRKMKAPRLRCYLYSKLLWVLLGWDICNCFSPLIWEKYKRQVSIYKCFALLKLQVHEVRNILFYQVKRVEMWLKKMYDYFVGYGMKEDRKGRVSVTDLLKIQTTK